MTQSRSAQGRRAHRAGHLGERIAVCMLRIKGYRILAIRYRTPVGEIDIIARRRDVIVYVEVKSRTDAASALEAVSLKSQARIVRAAAWYGQGKNMAALTQRFDVIAVGGLRWPMHVENAFGW